MVVVYKDTESFIPILPRETITDTELITMFLTGESDNIRVEFPVVVESYVNGILILNVTQIAVVTKVSQTFKLEIKIDEDFVYLGMLITVDSDTDIQNYSPASQTTSIFE